MSRFLLLWVCTGGGQHIGEQIVHESSRNDTLYDLYKALGIEVVRCCQYEGAGSLESSGTTISDLGISLEHLDAMCAQNGPSTTGKVVLTVGSKQPKPQTVSGRVRGTAVNYASRLLNVSSSTPH